ncbi:MerC mercury resistance protein [Belliella baltica DSM 15883]|uniref:MerC mercury resistance protein n=1 Tax=Belliella baltica (strain DSM 15883 / CIP 108006 / LMG 21964 / BA134) TaxID=866536 RepID=I3Z0B2_BELBD|nr:MerC domain-containing protein [Belliella baltica]AFL82680.1 MerC mercury resistance protein [Belliella baltica DSM 15883]
MLQRIKRISTQSADLMGISASLLCLIHCLVFPVFISLGFIFSPSENHIHDHNHEHVHFDWHILDYLFILLAIWAVYNAVKSTQSKSIKIALWIAVSIFSIGVILHEIFDWMIIISFLSSVGLVIIHVINWKFHRKCNVIVK